MAIAPSTAGWPKAANIRAAQVTTGSIAGAASSSITVAWPSDWENDDYTVVASVLEATATDSTLRVHHIESKTATQVVVRVINDDGTNAKTGTLHVVGMRGLA